jgi:4-hydroxybenzoate polyprenyltransferase
MFRKSKIFLEMIKFEHTIFALPFAYVGAILSSAYHAQSPLSFLKAVWITLAMIGARTAAMALNRYIDAAIDAKNPRTATRAIPAKLISKNTVIVFIFLSLGVLIVSAAQLHIICLYLSPIALFFLITYSYTKRFTWLCHYYLGITIAIAPLGGWLAIQGTIDWTAYLLFGAVALWIAGFDILYACQDENYDREVGLFSIPSRFGIGRALLIARVTHVFSFLLFFSLYIFSSLSWLFLVGLVLTALLLYYQHAIVRKDNLSRLNQAFFMMNGILSTNLFVCTLLDVVIFYDF